MKIHITPHHLSIICSSPPRVMWIFIFLLSFWPWAKCTKTHTFIFIQPNWDTHNGGKGSALFLIRWLFRWRRKSTAWLWRLPILNQEMTRLPGSDPRYPIFLCVFHHRYTDFISPHVMIHDYYLKWYCAFLIPFYSYCSWILPPPVNFAAP